MSAPCIFKNLTVYGGLAADRPLIQIFLDSTFRHLEVELHTRRGCAPHPTMRSLPPYAGSAQSSPPAYESADHAAGSSKFGIDDIPSSASGAASRARRSLGLTPLARELCQQQKMQADGLAQLRPFRLAVEQAQLCRSSAFSAIRSALLRDRWRTAVTRNDDDAGRRQALTRRWTNSLMRIKSRRAIEAMSALGTTAILADQIGFQNPSDQRESAILDWG